MTTIEVRAEQPYPVVVEGGARHRAKDFIRDAAQVAIIHPPVLAAHAARLAAEWDIPGLLIEVPDAEAAKTPQMLVDCWERLAAAGFTRSDVIVGFGGGATTDLAGFVAATWLRGVRLVTVPTTVLAMVDAAVGGKTGINLPAGKNLVGAFYEPQAVLCDLDLLSTLPPAEVSAGLAEVIKCGFIADPQILELVAADPSAALQPDNASLAELITRGITVKATVVATDLREATSQGQVVGRELLNYGHTFAHAIERVNDYQWRHGDAVAVGMCFAASLAHRLGLIDAALLEQHHRALTSVGLPTSAAHAGEWAKLRAAMALDKKARGAHLRFVLLDGLASARIVADPPEEILAQAHAELAHR